MHIGCGNQVTHHGLQGLVPHPVLNSPYVETLTQHPRRVGGSKCLQNRTPPHQGLLARRRPYRDAVYSAHDRRSAREHENTSTRLRVANENISQADRCGHLSLFPALREKAEIWLGSHPDRPYGINGDRAGPSQAGACPNRHSGCIAGKQEVEPRHTRSGNCPAWVRFLEISRPAAEGPNITPVRGWRRRLAPSPVRKSDLCRILRYLCCTPDWSRRQPATSPPYPPRLPAALKPLGSFNAVPSPRTLRMHRVAVRP
jgi:hypothetical protein